MPALQADGRHAGSSGEGKASAWDFPTPCRMAGAITNAVHGAVREFDLVPAADLDDSDNSDNGDGLVVEEIGGDYTTAPVNAEIDSGLRGEVLRHSASVAGHAVHMLRSVRAFVSEHAADIGKKDEAALAMLTAVSGISASCRNDDGVHLADLQPHVWAKFRTHGLVDEIRRVRKWAVESGQSGRLVRMCD